MRYLALATDYDGTLAHDGRVDAPTVEALKRFRDSGRNLIMVTGRELDELLQVCDAVEMFDCIVAENGALLYWPATKQEKPLAPLPPAAFIESLRSQGVPVSVGRSIVATWLPHDKAVLDTIRRFGLELQVIFNKGAVMILASGVNKASGLAAALDEMRLSPHNVVAVGDAENDHALLASCEASAAVSNALPMLKEHADLVTTADHGKGVAELINRVLDDDLASLDPKLSRHYLRIGSTHDDEPVEIHPYNERVLVTGRSGSGKSTLTTAFLEQLTEHGYQFCVIDPEGDYDELKVAVTQGNRKQPPEAEQLVKLLDSPKTNAIANLIGVPLKDRPTALATLLARLLEMRSRVGRPHWTIIDEAHHMLPAGRAPTDAMLPAQLDRVWMVTLEAKLMNHRVLAEMDTIIATGDDAGELIRILCEAVGDQPPKLDGLSPGKGEAIVWRRGFDQSPFVMRVEPGKSQRHLQTLLPPGEGAAKRRMRAG